MDETDEKILAKLVENSRMPISKISAQTGIPDSTVSNRLKKLEKSNIIDKYTTILNPEELGINVAAIIIIQTETEKHASGKLQIKRFLGRFAKDRLKDIIFFHLRELSLHRAVLLHLKRYFSNSMAKKLK